ncbi:hypothetical protein [Micromonospora pattaloongensis]|uniref:hypothetical protein n=1 Tax=Micromonospora pattaloongensis TaxID=405436 RepID=UPI000B85027D|nr:hypothetical protein [Micromonospora pattaloongensis]
MKVGQPFEYTQTFSDNSPPVQWRITVTKLVCGIKSIPHAAANPKWQGESDVPEYITATPEAGKEFCRVDATLTNIGKTPGSSMDFADVVLDKGQFASSSSDEEATGNLNNLLNEDTTTNPRATVKAARVWSVPTGSTPVAVLFPFETVFSGPTYRIEL